MTTTYLELINRGARHYPDRTAIVFGEQTLSFADVDHLSSQLAHALHAHGAPQGSRVALLLNNGLYSVPVDFACVRAGINRVPLNARLSVAEHVRMLQETQCSALLFGADLVDHAAALKEQLPELACFGLDASLPGGEDLMTKITA